MKRNNAIKFRSEDTPVVRISAEERNQDWVINITDNGIGMDPKYADRVFMIFQRLHTKKAYPGNGIGLAVCKRIVERHNGSIKFESAPGEGTVFHITLPKEQPTEEKVM